MNLPLTKDKDYKMTEEKKVQPKGIYQKIFAMQHAISGAAQEAKQGMQYKPISHWSITKTVKEQAEKHKLVLLPYVKSSSHEGNDTWVTVAIQITDTETGEQIVIGDYVGQGRDTQDKGAGKAVSYAIKTAYLKIFLMPLADDTEIEHDQGITVKELKTAVDRADFATVEKCKKFLAENEALISQFKRELFANSIWENAAFVYNKLYLAAAKIEAHKKKQPENHNAEES